MPLRVASRPPSTRTWISFVCTTTPIITEAGAIPPQMAYVIIREFLGWDIGEFKSLEPNHYPEG